MGPNDFHHLPGKSYTYSNALPLHSYSYLAPHLEKLIQHADPSSEARALDYGCGNGTLTAWLARRGFIAIGADISSSGVDIATANFPEATFTGDVSEGNLLKLGPFEVVLCNEVIAHCSAPTTELKKLFNCLRPGGALILTTPYHGYLKNLVMAATGRLEHHLDTLGPAAYLHFFNTLSLRSLLEEVGFREISLARAGRFAWLAKSIVAACIRPMK